MTTDLRTLTQKIHHLELTTNRTVNEIFAGQYKSSFKGQGLEVKDLRRYEEGDDARHIDWITSAKEGRLYTKQYRETRELSTMLLVDVSSSMNFTSTGKKKHEQVLELSAIVLFSALKNNDRCGAILFSDKVERYIPPKKGKSHALRILREIITQYQTNAYKPSNYSIALQFFTNVVKKHSISLFISDELSLEGTKLLRIANRKHDFVFVNVHDPLERGRTVEERMQIENPETGEQITVNLADPRVRERFENQCQERYDSMVKLSQTHNIDMIEISTEDDVYKELLKFFKWRQHKR